jgi:hypothetical protein
MTPFAQRLQAAYFHANQASMEHGHGPKSTAQFMKEAYPLYEEYDTTEKRHKVKRYRLVNDENRWGRWKNKDSARRAYSKLTSNRGGKGQETSGKRYEKISSAFYGASHKETIHGGKVGLWRVDIHYGYTNEEGKYVTEYRSFTMDSDKYTTLEDLPYLYSIVGEQVDEHMEYWQETDSIWENYELLDVTITPIKRSTLSEEYERERGTWGTKGQGRVHIDYLEIE